MAIPRFSDAYCTAADADAYTIGGARIVGAWVDPASRTRTFLTADGRRHTFEEREMALYDDYGDDYSYADYETARATTVQRVTTQMEALASVCMRTGLSMSDVLRALETLQKYDDAPPKTTPRAEVREDLPRRAISLKGMA